MQVVTHTPKTLAKPVARELLTALSHQSETDHRRTGILWPEADPPSGEGGYGWAQGGGEFCKLELSVQ